MIKQLIGILAAIALLIFCTLLPFLPGQYDPVAIPISTMALVAGVLGLVLVPSGLLLLAANRVPALAQRRYALSLFTLIASSLVWGGVFLAAFFQSVVLAFVVFVLWLITTVTTWTRLRTTRSFKALPYYLVAVPIVTALLQFVLLKPAVEYSRHRAIAKSAPLIAAIEQHHAANGRYPTSLQSVHPDFKPNVIGIPQYEYESRGDSYNLYFEQFTYKLGAREFVMYNPNDEHVMTSHASDLLELTPAQLALEHTRGHYGRFDMQQPHWRYFWFD
jgi:hypothetical protein